MILEAIPSAVLAVFCLAALSGCPRSGSGSGSPSELEDGPMCMWSEDVVSITQYTSSSSASVGSSVSLELKTLRMTGEGSRLVGGKAEKYQIDRTIDAASWGRLQVALKQTCVPVMEVTEPSELGGGTVYWEVRTSSQTIAFGLQSAVSSGLWGELSSQQWDTLVSLWPQLH